MIFGTALIGRSGFTPMEFISSSTNFDSSSSGGMTRVFSAPVGVQDGDMLFAFMDAGTAGAAMTTVPDGFTLQGLSFGGGPFVNKRFEIWVKKAQSESGGYTFGGRAGGRWSGAILVYRGARGFVAGISPEPEDDQYYLPSIHATRPGNLIAFTNYDSDMVGMTLRASVYPGQYGTIIHEENPNGTGHTGPRVNNLKTTRGILVQIT